MLKFGSFEEASDTAASSLWVSPGEAVSARSVVLDVRGRLTGRLSSSELTTVGNDGDTSVHSEHLLTSRVEGIPFTELGIWYALDRAQIAG